MRRGLVFATDALEPLLRLSREAEQAGFARVWTTEYPGRDAVARALAIALGTDRIEVGTGIAYAFTRLPLAMGALAADVRRLSGGRFALGLGTGTRGVRRWYGADFDPAARRFAEYAAELRGIWAGMAELDEHGLPPLYGAGLTPVMVRNAVRAADGVLLHPLALVRTHLRERVLPAIQDGAKRREDKPFVAMWVITSLAADEELAREHARCQIAFYLSTPSYGSVVDGTPWADVAQTIRERFELSNRTATWAELGHAVPDSLVDELALVGTPDSVRLKAAWLEAELDSLGVDELVFQTVGAGLREDEVVENCAAILTALGGPRTTIGAGNRVIP
jgi:alkanesulfonate monooxygenase SsuD/methylene tetrahydromethanopterin reductase-like flavin-dependent oxidoreductase (luciferase family)